MHNSSHFDVDNLVEYVENYVLYAVRRATGHAQAKQVNWR